MQIITKLKQTCNLAKLIAIGLITLTLSTLSGLSLYAEQDLQPLRAKSILPKPKEKQKYTQISQTPAQNCGINVITGTLIILGETSVNISEKLKKLSHSFGDKTYLRSYSLAEIGSVLQQSGYEVYAFKDLTAGEIYNLCMLGKPVILHLKNKNHYVIVKKDNAGKLFAFDYPMKLTGTKKFQDKKQFVNWAKNERNFYALMIAKGKLDNKIFKRTLIENKEDKTKIENTALPVFKRKEIEAKKDKQNRLIYSDDLLLVTSDGNNAGQLSGKLTLHNNTSEPALLAINGECGCFLASDKLKNILVPRLSKKIIDLNFRENQFDKNNGTKLSLFQITNTTKNAKKFVGNVDVLYATENQEPLRITTIPNVLFLENKEEKFVIELYIESNKGLENEDFKVKALPETTANIISSSQEKILKLNKKYTKISLLVKITSDASPASEINLVINNQHKISLPLVNS